MINVICCPAGKNWKLLMLSMRCVPHEMQLHVAARLRAHETKRAVIALHSPGYCCAVRATLPLHS